jgi:hypothetical protein
MEEHYPSQRTPTLRRISGSGHVWILEAFIDYGDQVAHAISVQGLKDGLVIRETDYFGQPFEAPQWRTQWVERFDATPAEVPPAATTPAATGTPAGNGKRIS